MFFYTNNSFLLNMLENSYSWGIHLSAVEFATNWMQVILIAQQLDYTVCFPQRQACLCFLNYFPFRATHIYQNCISGFCRSSWF